LTLPAILGYQGICFASPMAWIFADVPLMAKYFWMARKWKKSGKLDLTCIRKEDMIS